MPFDVLRGWWYIITVQNAQLFRKRQKWNERQYLTPILFYYAILTQDLITNICFLSQEITRGRLQNNFKYIYSVYSHENLENIC